MKTVAKFGLASSFVLFALLANQPVHADDVDVEALVKSKILTCIHPTVNVEKATIESQPSKTSGDTTTTRVKIFYEGLLKKNSLEMDVLVRASGSIRQFKADVLSDTGMSLKSCAMTKNWTDF